MKKKNKRNYCYNNRELSWLDFNFRVLEEALDEHNPIIERAKFLGITASNLDEFFMVRVSNVIKRMGKKPKKRDLSGFKPKKLFGILSKKIHKFFQQQISCFKHFIIPELKKNKIEFLSWKQLDEHQKMFLENYFERIVFPVLTPMAIDPGRPFPFISGRSLNIAFELKNAKGKTVFGIVNVPPVLPRYIELQCESSRKFIFLEQLIESQIHSLFELYDVKSSCFFRITRNSDFEIDEEAENILTEVQKSIKKRKRGSIVRLEFQGKQNKKECSETKKFLIKMFKVKKDDVYQSEIPIDLRFLMKFTNEKWDPKLRFAPQQSANPAAAFYKKNNVFDAIQESDLMVAHPFESFDAVVNFVKQAAEDPKVLAIKQTLYRVSANSPIIDALIKAADNGKQVTAFVELKARFDEENNILWAQKLEKSGCHVIYGIPGLKTHCKIILVVRQEGETIRRYLHLGTGNYNDITAKYYTDVGLFTCKTKFGMDASALFNSLTGYSHNEDYQKLIVSPKGTRKFFKKMIDNEIKNAKSGSPSKIIIKVNAIVDKDIINKLYDASNAGVKIKMIIRGMCCLIPGLKKMSENIEVISIVGRLLEHSRIFYFENGGSPQIFMGSADLMPRNLNRRIEVIFPVEQEPLKKRAADMLNLMLSDTVNARIQNEKTHYKRVYKKEKRIINSQMEFFKIAHGDLKKTSAEPSCEKQIQDLANDFENNFENIRNMILSKKMTEIRDLFYK
ncbi:MAG: polyphosphate kinase 1 [Oscillospiraceae bacterium]|nr:polyphosphate kinase 1 [Oscillospiraceae bacterium]